MKYSFLTLLTATLPLVSTPTVAQIIPDNTLGAENSTIRQDIINNLDSDVIEGGALRDNNLFHSFQEFNVEAGRGAYFANPEAVANILTRVTGSNVSEILGTLGVLGNGNLFLINPNGIIFGNNASLDLNGSFFASTADSLIFENGFEFSASNPQAPPLLTVNIPVGLRFRENAGDIILEADAPSTSLQVSPRQTLGLIGGNVSLDGKEIISPDSNVTIGGLSTAGVVTINPDLSLSYPEQVTRGNVSLSNNAQVNVTGNGEGGNISIVGENLTVSGGGIQAGIGQGFGSPTAQAGNISFDIAQDILIDGSAIANFVQEFAQGNGGDIMINTSNLTLTNGAQISASTFGIGNAGKIDITASDSITVTGESRQVFTSLSVIASLVLGTAEGNSGGIRLETSTLTLANGAQINASTVGRGDAGAIEITASDSITLTGESSQGGSAIASAVFGTADGNNDGITIDTSTLTLEDGAQISTSTFGIGDAGAIEITASESITLSGESSQGLISAITSGVFLETAEGNSGGIRVETSDLTLANGAQINATTFGIGEAGAIEIIATDTVTLTGESSLGFLTRILSQIAETAEGNSGGIRVETSDLTLANGARINASTFGIGEAGAIEIIASDAVTLTGESKQGLVSQITSEVGETGKENSRGIMIDTSTLTLENGAVVNTSTFGEGNAGDIEITANQSVSVSGTFFLEDLNRNLGGILAFTQTTGEAGDININTEQFSIADGAGIEAFTQGPGNAGSVTINSPDLLDIGQNSQILVETQSAGRPGNITINTEQLIIGINAQLSATATETATNPEGGGNITINSGNLRISGQLGIFAETAGETPAGSLTLQPNPDNPNLNIRFSDEGFISASTSGNGAGGDINLNAPATINLGGEGRVAVETSNVGNAGDINISAENLILSDGVEMTASTTGAGAAGQIVLNLTNNLSLTDSSITASTSADSFGNGGNIDIDPDQRSAAGSAVTRRSTADLVTLDNSSILVNSEGAGDAGNIFLIAGDLLLNNQSTISAETASGEGGNINLSIAETLRLDNNSPINTTAGGTGNGGDITINSQFIIANNNSDIRANAFEGTGGNINLTAQGLFFSPDSEIDASSDLGIDGVVETNTPDVDPAEGLIELESDVVDAAELIAQNVCEQTEDSEFVITGRGGLPPNPDDFQVPENTEVDLIIPSDSARNSTQSDVFTVDALLVEKIVPARGLIVDENGQATLVGYDLNQGLSQRQKKTFNPCLRN